MVCLLKFSQQPELVVHCLKPAKVVLLLSPALDGRNVQIQHEVCIFVIHGLSNLLSLRSVLLHVTCHYFRWEWPSFPILLLVLLLSEWLSLWLCVNSFNSDSLSGIDSLPASWFRWLRSISPVERLFYTHLCLDRINNNIIRVLWFLFRCAENAISDAEWTALLLIFFIVVRLHDDCLPPLTLLFQIGHHVCTLLILIEFVSQAIVDFGLTDAWQVLWVETDHFLLGG